MQANPGRTGVLLLMLLAFAGVLPRSSAQEPAKSVSAVNTLFAPLQQWRSAIVAGDAAALRSLYSANPEARIEAPAGQITSEGDVAFWTGLQVRKLELDVSQSDESQTGLEKIVFQAEIRSAPATDRQARYINEGQIWQQQGAQWRLIFAKRTDLAHLEQPMSVDNQIYEPGGDARAEIQRGLQRAARDRKRVLVVFGANWCYDCHVLDLAFHRHDIAAVLARDYEIVHVDIGQGDKNQDLMKQYGVPMAKGIPAIAVLDANGKVLFSQKSGEFANARALAPDDLLGFLNRWKARAE